MLSDLYLKEDVISGTGSGICITSEGRKMEKMAAQKGDTPNEKSGRKCDRDFKPGMSYIALISMAIQSAPDQKMLLSEIYQWISERYPYYQIKDKSWRNSIRHNLSLNECFVKCGRSENGKGNYWSIHPANMEDFANGDYRRRRARRRVRKCDEDLKNLCCQPPPIQMTQQWTPCNGYVPMVSRVVPSDFITSTFGFSRNNWFPTQNPCSGMVFENSSQLPHSEQSYSQYPSNFSSSNNTASPFESTVNVNVNVNVCGNNEYPSRVPFWPRSQGELQSDGKSFSFYNNLDNEEATDFNG